MYTISNYSNMGQMSNKKYHHLLLVLDGVHSV